MKKMRICLAHEVASQNVYLHNMLVKEGKHTPYSIVFFSYKYHANNFEGKHCACKIRASQNIWLNRLYAGIKIIKNIFPILRNDIFHFFGGCTLCTGWYDLFVLKKLLGKKIIIEFNGNEIRTIDGCKKQNPFYEFIPEQYISANFQNKQTLHAKLQKMGHLVDAFIIPYWELYEYVKDIIPTEKIFFKPHLIHIPTKQKREIYENTTNKIKILHCPSNTNIKGTSYIHQIMKELTTVVEYKELTGVPRNVVINEINKADIILDQILLGDYGVFALEAMSMGKPVMCYLLDDVQKKYPPTLPIINVSIHTLKEKIVELHNNRKNIVELGKLSYEYVSTFHSEKNISSVYNAILSKITS